MTEINQRESEVYRFILEHIESVPHLEALTLLWNGRPQPWTVENLAQRLYVSEEMVESLLQDLKLEDGSYCFQGRRKVTVTNRHPSRKTN